MFLRREHSLFQLAYWKYRSILSLKSYLKMTEFSCHAFLFLPFEGVIPNDIYGIILLRKLYIIWQTTRKMETL